MGFTRRWGVAHAFRRCRGHHSTTRNRVVSSKASRETLGRFIATMRNSTSRNSRVSFQRTQNGRQSGMRIGREGVGSSLTYEIMALNIVGPPRNGQCGSSLSVPGQGQMKWCRTPQIFLHRSGAVRRNRSRINAEYLLGDGIHDLWNGRADRTRSRSTCNATFLPLASPSLLAASLKGGVCGNVPMRVATQPPRRKTSALLDHCGVKPSALSTIRYHEVPSCPPNAELETATTPIQISLFPAVERIFRIVHSYLG